MSICSSGISAPKAGVATSVVVTPQYVQSLLPPALAWLFPYLPWMQGLVIGDVATFCAGDPPTWTVPSSSDLLAFVTGGPYSSYLLVNQFISDVAKAYLWYSLCECTTVATPAPPTAPAPPSGIGSINPPVGTTLAAPCFSQEIFGYEQPFLNGANWYAAPAPAGVTHARITATLESTTNASLGSGFFWGACPTSAHTSCTNFTNNNALAQPGATVTADQDITTAIPYAFVAIGGHASQQAAGRAKWTFKIEWWCTSVTQPSPCTPCPPDPLLVARLNQILDLVTIIQRQAVPFAYVPGAVHTGLSGAGSISISGLIGYSVDVTTLPTQIGESGTMPAEYFDLGWITVGTADGAPQSRRLEHNPQLDLPCGMSAMDTLWYDLHPGVVATITELVREP